MDIRSPKVLKAAAADALSHYPNNRKIVLIWAGVSLGLSFVVSLLNFVLQNQMADTGGLSGIGLRSALSTAQSVLTLGVGLFTPFWGLGYTSAMMGFAMGQTVNEKSLFNGFRRFGPGMRLLLLRYVIYFVVMLLGFYIGAMVLAMTPLARPVYALIEGNLDAFSSYTPDEGMLEQLIPAMTPLLIGCAVITVAAIIPVFYHLRLTDYLIMDELPMGAIPCALTSNRMMRRNCMALVRLDLSYWWFYLLYFLTTSLGYGDMLLSGLGITLPMNANVAFFLFYVVSLLAQFAVFYFHGNRVYATYAVFYDALRHPVPKDRDVVV